MTGLAHHRDSTHPSLPLAEITERIYAKIDRFALDLGRLLQIAYESHPNDYRRWVEEDLPFGLDKASRLRMVYKAAEHLPDDVLARMPSPWQALYALTRLPANVVIEAVESGEIHPGLSARDSQALGRRLSGRETLRHSEADLLIGRLVGFAASEASPAAARLLRGWVHALPDDD